MLRARGGKRPPHPALAVRLDRGARQLVQNEIQFGPPPVFARHEVREGQVAGRGLVRDSFWPEQVRRLVLHRAR
eukprot:1593892-Pyramimonas_sp.AAC.1